MSDNTKLVKDWAQTFELLCNESPKVPSEDEIRLGIKLIREEVGELENNIFIVEEVLRDKIDISKIADDVSDILWVVLRFASIFGIDIDSCIKEVYKSNMSKLCKNKQELEHTLQYYRDEGVECYYKAVEKGDSQYYIIKRKEDDKVLKNINWSEPNFTKILKETHTKEN